MWLRRGLPDHQRAAAARVFQEAFSDKLLMPVPVADRQLPFLEATLDREHIVIALLRDELVGLMGLSTMEGAYRGGVLSIDGQGGELRRLLGRRGHVRASVGLRIAAHRPARGELYVDGIAVAATSRGQGIGSRLLEEARAIAREHGLRWLRLEVVDTNPGAQRLYERLGFRVTHVRSFRLLSRFMGYGAVISMELAVEADDAASDRAPERG